MKGRFVLVLKKYKVFHCFATNLNSIIKFKIRDRSLHEDLNIKSEMEISDGPTKVFLSIGARLIQTSSGQTCDRICLVS